MTAMTTEIVVDTGPTNAFAVFTQEYDQW